MEYKAHPTVKTKMLGLLMFLNAVISFDRSMLFCIHALVDSFGSIKFDPINPRTSVLMFVNEVQFL